MKKFLESAKAEFENAYEEGNVEKLNRAAEKIVNITKSMWMMGVKNINDMQ